jgi:predicted nucleotide-binding protein
MSLSAIIAKLDQLVDEGSKCETPGAYDAWSQRTYEFLLQTFDYDVAKSFNELSYSPAEKWWLNQGRQIGMLEGLSAFRQEGEAALEALTRISSSQVSAPSSKRVFVVHGHDTGAKEMVARYLERLGLQAVILHEQANEGRTVIEKIEAHSDVGFAVILLTPDDVGGPKTDAINLMPRARQNVILELGYFLGKLKRSRVCALYKPGVEIPSDYQGVLWIELDDKGAWRVSLAQEFSNARLPIDVKGVLGS